MNKVKLKSNVISEAPIVGDALMAWTAFYVRPSVRSPDPAKTYSPIATKFGM